MGGKLLYIRRMQSLIAEWLDYVRLEKRLSARTGEIYRNDFQHFCAFWQEYHGAELTREDLPAITVTALRAWLAKRVGGGYSAASNRAALVALRSFFRFIHQRHGIENAAVFAIKSPKKARSLPRAIEETQVPVAVSGLEVEGWVAARDRALFILLYGAGLRISEALSLNIGDVSGPVIKVRGKGNKERIVPLLPEVRDGVSQYLKLRPHLFEATAPLFVGVQGKRLKAAIFQKKLRELRMAQPLPDHLTPHALRHSFASHMLQNGADLRVIQECLGHASLSTTQVYTHLNAKQLTEAYSQLFPRK